MQIPLEALFTAFGLNATVIAPRAERAVSTTIVWLPPDPEFAPDGDLSRAQKLRLAALKRAEVADIPVVRRETVIEAPERLGGTATTWLVVDVAQEEVDILRVYVLPKSECCE